ncbi:hypothetical protein BD324DRAFT_603248 [Kockovaella imperatae]|uniref:Uncharacterized protein n=1 Tax=Kockovaella imperatae TaxID=4999 RepID=A0A1Y1UAZ4_9TREE|nr:hypothetical protein BD324DRAFT_603248 [Kockovaella imperatae]ORX35210.1 hypothetical protein BD324DRAFT_603248 [Kockovaella imperatae]
MAIVEDVAEDSDGTRVSQGDSLVSEDLLSTLLALCAKFRLPPDMVPAFMQEDQPLHALRAYQNEVLEALRRASPLIRSPAFERLDLDEQGRVVGEMSRLYGSDPWCSPGIISEIDQITEGLPRPTLAVHLLQSLRPIFSSTAHPMINPFTSRALSRPAGGTEAKSDFHDESAQTFKLPEHWGSYNILGWSCDQLPSSDIEQHIGLILPPTLVLMDDWESPWRGRGVKVLDRWIDKVSAETLRRMGMDKLLSDTLIHTLSIHPDQPLSGVLETALKLINRTTKGRDKVKAERIEEIMDKAIIKGWIYAPAGQKGRASVIHIAKQLETLCEEVGSGMVRWLKSIIPHLVDPLQYTPSAAVVEHYASNLRALLCVMRTCKETGRIPRWRGQIIDFICRLWVQVQERSGLDEALTPREIQKLSSLIVEVFGELIEQHPAIREKELPALVNINSGIFGPLVKAVG